MGWHFLRPGGFESGLRRRVNGMRIADLHPIEILQPSINERHLTPPTTFMSTEAANARVFNAARYSSDWKVPDWSVG